MAPVRNAAGEVTFFVGVQLDVTAAPPQEEESLGNGAVANGVASAAAAAAAALGCPAPSGRRPSFAGEPGLREKRAQKSVVGAVRVACRSLSGVGRCVLRGAYFWGLGRALQPGSAARGCFREIAVLISTSFYALAPSSLLALPYWDPIQP